MPRGPNNKRLLVVLVALAAGLVGYFSYGIALHLQEELEQRLAGCRILSERADHVSLSFMERHAAFLHALALVPAVRSHDAAASEIFRRLSREFPDTENIAATGRDGCFFASSMPLPSPNRCISQLEFFRRVAEGAKLAVMQPHTGPISGELVTGLAVPILADDGSFNGLVGATIRYRSLVERWEAMEHPRGTSLAVYGSAGVVRFASGALSGLAGRAINGEASVLTNIRGDEGLPVLTLDGVDYLAVVSTSPRSGLTFVSVAPRRVGIGQFLAGHPQSSWMLSFLALLLASAAYLQFKHKQWVDALAESEDRFRMILEHSPVGVVVYDGHTGLCLDANKAMAELLGASREQLLRQNFRDIETWRHSGLLRMAQKALDGNGPQRLDIRQTSTFGKEVMLDCLMTGYSSGNASYLLLIAADIAEKTRVQNFMVQTEKMMSLGGLAAGMAHEINNPLSGIIQNLQVLSKRLGEDSPRNRKAAEESGYRLEALWEYLKRREAWPLLEGVRESAVRASATVKNMLDFARKAGGDMAPGDVNAIVDKALVLSLNDYDLNKRYDFRKISVEKDYDPALPPVPCNANQLMQVLLNLLRNAAQAMRPENGTPGRIVLRTRSEDGHVRIEVQDNGPGMAEQVRAHVFEPFFSTKEAGEGTGLGLSVSYFIITSAHKGRFEVDSEPGKGTTFAILLPLVQTEEVSPPPSSTGRRPAGNGQG